VGFTNFVVLNSKMHLVLPYHVWLFGKNAKCFLSLRKIFNNLVVIELDILHINVSIQNAILFFPKFNTSKI
jgi:hypothetical protein